MLQQVLAKETCLDDATPGNVLIQKQQGQECPPKLAGKIKGTLWRSAKTQEKENTFFKKRFIFNYVYVYLSLCVYVHVNTGACGGKSRASDPLELAL